MKTALSSDLDRRQEIRYSLVGEVPARLYNQGSQEELAYLTIDVSHRGLGLLVTPSPAEGQVLHLDFMDADKTSLILICRHVHAAMQDPLQGFESMRRCGLELHSDQQAKIDLVDFFSSFDSVLIGD